MLVMAVIVNHIRDKCYNIHHAVPAVLLMAVPGMPYRYFCAPGRRYAGPAFRLHGREKFHYSIQVNGARFF